MCDVMSDPVAATWFRLPTTSSILSLARPMQTKARLGNNMDSTPASTSDRDRSTRDGQFEDAEKANTPAP